MRNPLSLAGSASLVGAASSVLGMAATGDRWIVTHAVHSQAAKTVADKMNPFCRIL